MPAKWKGSQGPIESHREAIHDAETRSYEQRRVYRGSASAISGLELTLQNLLISYDVRNDGPVYDLTARIPLINPSALVPDRYQISTEPKMYEIWESRGIFAEATNYDRLKAVGDPTYRELAELAVKGTGTVTLNSLSYPYWTLAVTYLRAGVDHLTADRIVLSIFRKIDQSYGITPAGQFTLDGGDILYTTAQLNLPAEVAFKLPVAPAADPDYDLLYFWSWRKRTQNVDIVGSWLEEHVDFEFAPHVLLDRVKATANFAW